MKTHLHRLLALFLCLSFVCSLIPATAAAVEDLLYFQVENAEATLTGSSYEISGDVVIPAEYQGYPVTAIGAYAFSDECNIQSITIPHTVTSIHREAFMCVGLEAFRVEESNPVYQADSRGVLYSKDGRVLVRAPLQLSGSYTVASGVTAIEEYAFHLCFNLTEVILPGSLTHIGNRAFDACNRLNTPCLPDGALDIGVYAFSGCFQFTYSTYDNAKYLGTAQNPYYALIDAISEEITALEVHPDARLIAGAALRKCSGLEKVTLPEGLQRIGTWAFDGCSALKTLQLPSTVQGIGDDAFSGSGLTEFTVPEGVQHIGSGAFLKCDALTCVTLPESLISIGEKAFAQTALTEIRLGKNVSQIGATAFYDCGALTGIWVNEDNAHYSSDSHGVLFNNDQTVLLCAPGLLSGHYPVPGSVTHIEDYAFYRCSELTEITLTDCVVSIGAYGFFNCLTLTAIEIPESVTHIGAYAFAACQDLTTVTIPKGITELPAGLFSDAFGLKTVFLPEGMTKIGGDAFYGCRNLQQIQIPHSVTHIGENAFRACNKLQTVTIPEGVTVIGSYAFYGCNGLTRVSIPNSIQRVGFHAFSNCTELVYGYTLGSAGRYVGNEENPCLVLLGVSDDEVSRITLDPGTKVIADGALASCCELSTLTLPEGLLTIGNMSLYCCESLRNLTIPDTVTYIGANAFERGRLTQIVIPASVGEIGDYAFGQCSKLTALRFCGRLPLIGRDAFEGVTATAYCHLADNADRMKNYGGNLTWADGHVFLNYLPDAGFSCPTGGTKTAKCEGCSETDTVTVTEPAEHCFEMGQCSICGEKEGQSCFLTGTITSAGDSDTILTLMQDGEPVSTLTVTGNTYLWEQLQPGNYTLTAEKANHVTCRTELTVAPGENIFDLTLCRPGDVVGLGDLNIGDVANIYAHARGHATLTGYAKDCADVNGNGKVNVGDVAMLYAKIRGN